MVNYNPFEDEERSSAESYLPGKKEKKEKTEPAPTPPDFKKVEEGAPQNIKPFYSGSMDIEDRDTKPEVIKNQELLNRQMSDGFPSDNIFIEKKDPVITPKKLEPQDFQPVAFDNYETKSQEVADLGEDIKKQNLIISNQQSEFTKLNNQLEDLDQKIEMQGGKYDDLFGLIPESEKNLDLDVTEYNKKVQSHDKAVADYNAEVDRFMANPFGTIGSDGKYLKQVELEKRGIEIDKTQEKLEEEFKNISNRTTAAESFLIGNDPVFQRERNLYNQLVTDRESLIKNLTALADSLNNNIDNFKTNVDSYNSKALNVGAYVNQLNQAIETQQAIKDRVQYIEDLKKPAEPEREFWRINEPVNYRDFWEDKYTPQDPESFIGRDQKEVFKDLYVPQDPESFIQVPDKLEIEDPNAKRFTIGSIAQNVVDSAYKIKPGSSKGGAPELAKPEYVDKIENWATENIYNLELGKVAEKVYQELDKTAQILKGDVTAEEFFSKEFQKPEPKSSWGDSSFSPTVGTISEFTGLPYLYREAKKIPDVLVLQLDKNPNTKLSDLDDYAVAIGTLGGLVDPGVKFGDKEYSLSSILNPDGNENDKWRAVRQTNEFRETRPFGDIFFASEEGGDIISAAEKKGKKFGDVPTFIKGATTGDLSGWDPAYMGAYLGDQWRIADFALTALQLKYIGKAIEGIGRIPKGAIREMGKGSEFIKDNKKVVWGPDWMLNPVDLVNKKQFQAMDNYKKIGGELFKLGEEIEKITSQARYRNLMPYPFSREKYLPKSVANSLINKITNKQVKLAKKLKENSFGEWASKYTLDNIVNDRDKAIYNLIQTRKSEPWPINNQALKDWETGLGKIENDISDAVKNDIAFNQVEILYPQLDKRAQEKLSKELIKDLFGKDDIAKGGKGTKEPKERFIGARDFVVYNKDKKIDKLFKDYWQQGKVFPAPIKGGMDDFTTKDIYGEKFDQVVTEINQLRKSDPQFGLDALEGVLKRVISDGSYKKYMSIKTKNGLFDEKGKFNVEKALDWLDQDYKKGKVKRDQARKDLESQYKNPVPKLDEKKESLDDVVGKDEKTNQAPQKDREKIGKDKGLISGLTINKNLGGLFGGKPSKFFKSGEENKMPQVNNRGQDIGLKKPEDGMPGITWLSNLPGAGSDSPNMAGGMLPNNQDKAGKSDSEKPPKDAEKPPKDAEKTPKDAEKTPKDAEKTPKDGASKKGKKPRDYDPVKKPRDLEGVKRKTGKKPKDPEKPKKPKKRKSAKFDSNQGFSGLVMDSDKAIKKKKEQYPKVIQWKDGEKYKTIDLNTNQITTRDFPVAGGVNPGDTPEKSARIIKKQNKKPKLLREIGNLVIQIKGPNVVTVKQRENYLYNNNKRISLLV